MTTKFAKILSIIILLFSIIVAVFYGKNSENILVIWSIVTSVIILTLLGYSIYKKKKLDWVSLVLIIITVLYGIIGTWYFLGNRIKWHIRTEAEKQFIEKQLSGAPACSKGVKCQYWGWLAACGPINKEWEELDKEAQKKFNLGPDIDVEPSFLLGGDCSCYKNRCVLVPYDEPSIRLLEQYIKK